MRPSTSDVSARSAGSLRPPLSGAVLSGVSLLLGVLLLAGCAFGKRDALGPGRGPTPAPATAKTLRTAPTSTLAPGPAPGSAPRPQHTPSPGPTAGNDPGPAVATRAPRRLACYRLRTGQLTDPTNDARPLPCARPHTAQTIYVGRLRMVAGGDAVAVDSPAAQRQLATTCPRRLAAYLGGSDRTRKLSRLHVVWFGPTLAESDQGALWFRCDVVAFGRGDTLARLPRTGMLAGVLDRRRALQRYGLCGNAAPGAPRFERVICAYRHSWRAVDVVAVRDPGGDGRYPGVRRVRAVLEDRCRQRVRRRTGFSVRFRYGWEWPTAKQWRAGQRFGYCWAPD